MAYKYGIRIFNRDGSIGWIVGNDCKILLFKTKQEAVKALHLMKRIRIIHGTARRMWRSSQDTENNFR